MKPEKFVDGLKKEIIERGVRDYIEMLGNPRKINKTTNFYNDLNTDNKEIFVEIVNQIKIDTVAAFLSFLDGEFWIENQKEDLKLVCLDTPEEVINGDLTTIFLNREYNWEK